MLIPSCPAVPRKDPGAGNTHEEFFKNFCYAEFLSLEMKYDVLAK
jgi:hypothetical protein